VGLGNSTKVSGLIDLAQCGGTHSCWQVHVAKPCPIQEPSTRYSCVRGLTTGLCTSGCPGNALEVVGIIKRTLTRSSSTHD